MGGKGMEIMKEKERKLKAGDSGRRWLTRE